MEGEDMTKKDLIINVVNRLKDDDKRKPVSFPRHTFHISDSEGNHKDFIIKKSNKMVPYTVDDVNTVLDGLMEVILDALRDGDNISIIGFGTLGLHFRKPRSIKKAGTQEWTIVPGHFVPKLKSGSRMKLAAKLYELSLDGFDPSTGESYASDESIDDFDYDDDDDFDSMIDDEAGDDE